MVLELLEEELLEEALTLSRQQDSTWGTTEQIQRHREITFRYRDLADTGT